VRAVIALGGNALLEHSDPSDAAIEQRHARAAAEAIAPFAADNEVLVCHGNGPQVGTLAAESSDDVTLARPFPLDALGAQTQGMIGYWLAQALADAGVGRPVAVVVTQTVIDPADPAFANPTKFIGRGYDRARAKGVAEQYGWSVAADGDAWRRVVASPRPREIIELAVIRRLLGTGARWSSAEVGVEPRWCVGGALYTGLRPSSTRTSSPPSSPRSATRTAWRSSPMSPPWSATSALRGRPHSAAST
jgi:carbamate kinase